MDATLAEIHQIAADPRVSQMFPDGFDADDVLVRLHTIGSVSMTMAEQEGEDGARSLLYTVETQLRDGSDESADASGLTLCAAAMRCLLACEDALAFHAAEGFGAFDALLAGNGLLADEAELGQMTERGLDDLSDLLADA